MKGKCVRTNAGRGILGMLLVMVLFLGTVIPSYADETEKITITGLTAPETTSYEVESGTSKEDAAGKLPETVKGTYTAAKEKGEGSEEKAADLSVTWSCEDYEAENKTEDAKTYTFQAALTDETAKSYTLADGVTLPTVTVSVKPAEEDSRNGKNESLNEPAAVNEGNLSSPKAKIGNVTYDTLKAAVNAAKSGDTIQLGEGKYTLYNQGAAVLNKDLTFEGCGIGKTTWLVGPTKPDPAKYGTEYNSDYSFDVRGTEEVKETVTFKNMTLQSGSVNYLGFAGTDITVVENCVIEGKTFYWGYTSATFTNTTFNCPEGDYAIWTYSSPEMTFDGCTFNSTGKIINVYTDFGAGKQNIKVNFNDCTVNNNGNKKTVLKINDSNMGEYKYIIRISGSNVINGRDGKSSIDANSITCSRLFGYDEAAENSGRTEVYISNTKVWENGQRVGGHDQNLSGGSYEDGKADGDKLQYTDGYKDNAFDYSYKINGDWMKADEAPNDGWVNGVREVRKVCQYCGYTEEYTEKQSAPEEKKTSANQEEKKTYTESTEQAAPIVNTTNVAVGKVWQDGDNQDGIRPAGISVQLYRNGEPYGNPVTLNEENSWWYRWDYLDTESSWTVDELNVADGYTKTITKNAVNAWVIVNTHTPETQTVVPTDTAAAAPTQNQNLTGRGAGTGDEGNLLLWFALMALTGVGAAAGYAVYRRRSR